MKNKEYLLFDLDGTLTDPKVGITKSVQYALQKLGIETETEKLLHFIGPPLRDSFKKFYGFSDEKAETAVNYYREYFSVQGIFENSIYDGIESLLRQLNEKKKTLILATSKVTFYAEKILEHFQIAKYFSFVSGSEFDGRRSKKDEVIKYALDALKINDVKRAVMIGDREFDIIGAKEAGMDSVGVLYGYGTAQELQAAGAEHIISSVSELTKLVL